MIASAAIPGCMRVGFPVNEQTIVDDGATDDAVSLDGAAPYDAAPDDAAPYDAAPDDAGLDGSRADQQLADARPDQPLSQETRLPDARPHDAPRPDAPRPDAPTPDAPPPDANTLPDTQPRPDTQSRPDTQPPPDAGCQPPVGWWNSAYGYRRKLTITEAITGPLASGYSVVVTLDTQKLIAAGKLAPTGADLRVVQHGATLMELDRHVVGLNGSATRIWFKTQADITSSDSTYYLYYGNPSARAAPAHWADSMGTATRPSAVYLAADDFEDEALGASPGGWEGSSKYTVAAVASNKVLRVAGSNPDADYLFAGDYSWTDVVVQARLSVQKTSGDHYGLFTRADKATNFDTLWFGLQSNSQLAIFTCRLSSASAKGLSNASSKGTFNISPPAGTSWHVLKVTLQGSTGEFYYDGVKKKTYTISGTSMQKGRIGLCAGYPTSDAYWDDIIVRRYVNPEPIVAAAAEQVGCP